MQYATSFNVLHLILAEMGVWGARRAVRCTMLRRVRHARLERTAWSGDARLEKRC
jgi:hypothetical protein